MNKKKNHLALWFVVLIFIIIGLIVWLYYSRSQAGVVKPLKPTWFRPPSFLFEIYGEGQGILQEPIAAEGTADGDIYVADAADHSVKVYDRTGTFRFKFNSLGIDGSLSAPAGLAVLGDSILVSDTARNDIFKFDLQGHYQKRFPTLPAREELKDFTPLSLTVVNEHVYFTDILNHRIIVLNTSGDYVRAFGGPGQKEGSLAYPNDVAVAPDGRIYVSDSNNYRIQVTDSKQKLHVFRMTKGDVSTPVLTSLVRGIAVSPDGYIWVVDTLGHQVLVLNNKGEKVDIMGGKGIDKLKFYYPNSVRVTGDRVYITDRGNHRVKVYRY